MMLYRKLHLFTSGSHDTDLSFHVPISIFVALYDHNTPVLQTQSNRCQSCFLV